MTPDTGAEIADVCKPADSDARVKLCATCGERIEPTCRHPAAVSATDAGVVYIFCTAVCREEWLDDDTEH